MPESIPHEALARAVRAAFGATTRVVAAEPLFGDASSRRYLRLRLGPGTEPATVVAMLLGADRGPLEAEELGRPLARDVPAFVEVGRYLLARGLPVPAVYHDAARADALLLVEDVGDTTLWAAASARPAEAAPLFGAAVDLLVALQAAGTHHPARACRAFAQRFDTVLARWELEHFLEHGIETRHGRRLAPTERAALLAALRPVLAPFETDALVLAHRDFMAWNIHVQDGRLRLIDFQDALLAPDAYDLGALLTDRTTATLVDPSLETTLLARFVAARAAAGLPVTGDLPDRYRRCVLQRALKVIGRFHFLERVKGKPGYLAYLPAVWAQARRIFDALPDLAPARALLAPHAPELAGRPS